MQKRLVTGQRLFIVMHTQRENIDFLIWVTTFILIRFT